MIRLEACPTSGQHTQQNQTLEEIYSLEILHHINGLASRT